jgi:hypothetical protein
MRARSSSLASPTYEEEKNEENGKGEGENKGEAEEEEPNEPTRPRDCTGLPGRMDAAVAGCPRKERRRGTSACERRSARG